MSSITNGAFPGYQPCGCGGGNLLRWPIKNGVLNEDALIPVAGDWSIKTGTRTLQCAQYNNFDASIFSRPGCGLSYGQQISFGSVYAQRKVWYRIYVGATSDHQTWLAVDFRHGLKEDDTYQCTDTRIIKCVAGTETQLYEFWAGNGFTGLGLAATVIWKHELGRINVDGLEFEIDDPSPFRTQWGVGIVSGNNTGVPVEFPDLVATTSGRIYTAFTGCERRCSVQLEIANDFPDQTSDCGDSYDPGESGFSYGGVAVYYGWTMAGGAVDTAVWTTLGDFAVNYENTVATSGKTVIARMLRVYECDSEITIDLTVGAATAGLKGRARVQGFSSLPTSVINEDIEVEQGTDDTLTLTNLPVGLYVVTLTGHLSIPIIYYNLTLTGAEWLAAC